MPLRLLAASSGGGQRGLRASPELKGFGQHSYGKTIHPPMLEPNRCDEDVAATRQEAWTTSWQLIQPPDPARPRSHHRTCKFRNGSDHMGGGADDGHLFLHSFNVLIMSACVFACCVHAYPANNGSGTPSSKHALESNASADRTQPLAKNS